MGFIGFKNFRLAKVKKSFKKIKSRFWMAGFFVLLGILMFSFPQLYKSSQSRLDTASVVREKSIAFPSSNEPIKIDAKLLSSEFPSQGPSRIIVPSLNIDLPVVEAKVVNGFWETSETSASHGIGSANPGQIGNTVIFAHARKGLFLPLREIKNNDLIYVLTKDRWFRYKSVDRKEVTPDKVEVIAPTENETLTLYTCSGFLDSKRLIVIAKPLEN